MPGSRKTRHPIAVTVLSVAMVLLGLEVVLRIAGIGGPLELGPYFDRETIAYEQEIPWKRPLAWTRGPYLNVAVIGDSFTWGDGVAPDDAYPFRLQRLLNLNREPPVAMVRVFARNGLNTEGELHFLSRAVEWPADLVVLGMFLNDPEGPADAKAIERLLMPVPTGLTRSLMRSSRAFEFLWMRIERMWRNRGTPYADAVFDPASPGWQAFERALDGFSEGTREAGIPLVAVIFPNLGGLGPGYTRTGHERIGEALAARGIRTLDLLETFEPMSPLRLTVFPGVDAHPNEIAHRIAARAIFDYLLEEGLVGPEYRPRKVRQLKSEDEWLRQLRRYRSPAFYPP